jgi:fibronectin type 3 domain-containing protein
LLGLSALPAALSGCGGTVNNIPSTGGSSAYGVQLTWNETPGGDSAVSYNVFREQTAGFVQINASAVTTTSYLDSTAASGQTYVYMVESVDADGNASDPSETVTVAVP